MNITYLLGAGASANAIPIVERSNLRMQFFIYVLEEFALNINRSGKKEIHNIFIQRVKKYKNIFEQIKSHLSYDTFAKKLWLQKADKEDDFNNLKELMSLYYYFEHLPIEFKMNYKNGFMNKVSLQEKEEVNYLFKLYESQTDKRYDAFIAGIASPDFKVSNFIPSNINIVSWNYDLQIELALEQYLKFYYNYAYDPVMAVSGDKLNSIQYKFVKLNGSCGLNLINETNTVKKNYESIKPYFSFNNPDLMNEFINIINGYANLTNIKVIPYLNFAWEKNKYSTLVLDKACEIFKKTNGLVVIGYSFPLFNREVDKYLFKEFKIDRKSKIYVQTISLEEFERVRSRIKGIIKLRDDQIEYVMDVNQFFVPFELNENTYEPNTTIKLKDQT